jgi:hypothetical protein
LTTSQLAADQGFPLGTALAFSSTVLAYAEGVSVLMREWWSTRWYTPILGLAALLFALLVAGLAAMERLAADVPHAVTSHAWTLALDRADASLAHGDTAGAMSAWRDAHTAAMRSGQWEGMIAVGDASRRLGESSGSPRESLARARQAYLTALFRARRERSVEGSLRAAVAFGELGDRQVLAQALRIAERQAGRDPVSRARVRAVADRWMPSPRELDTRDPSLSKGHQP